MASRWMAPAAAAVAAVAVIGGGAALLSRGPDGPAAAAPAPTTTRTAADPLVRDGARVTVSGQVMAVPGRPVRMCAPLAVADVGYEPGHEPMPQYCEAGVTLRGADLATLADRKVDRGVTLGRARVDGTYRAGVVTVQRQAAPDPEDLPASTLPDRPPCPAPAGGWDPAGSEFDRLATYVRAHPDRYLDLYVTYPDGPPRSEGGATPQPGTMVPVVGTVLDPAAAERELRAVHPGNLCVVRATRSGAVLNRVVTRLQAEATTTAMPHGVYAFGPDIVTATVPVQLVVLDPAAKRWLAQLDDRTGVIVPDPWIRPLG